MDHPSLQPLGSNHPWQAAICPLVAIVGQIAIPIGTGFTIATFGLVLIPAVFSAAALNQSKQIGCVFGAGVFFPVDQIYTHGYTDFALLQLAPPSDGDPYPILPLTLDLPAAGMDLLAVGYTGFSKPGTIDSANRVTHNWQLCTYCAPLSDIAESPRKKGPVNKLLLLPQGPSLEPGMLGGPVFYANSNAVCAALGQHPSQARMVAYGMALSPALGLHALFPEGTALTYQSLYHIAKKDQFASIAFLQRLQLFPFDDRYSVVVDRDKSALTPDSWLLSQGLELGYYMAGGVPIIRYTPSIHGAAMPPATTAAHEKAHMLLMTVTEYGAFVSSVAIVIQRLPAPNQDMEQVMDHLMKASWLTQEGGATAVEVLSQLASPAFDLAALQKALPATYNYAFNLLARIVSTLQFPFLPGTEFLRYPICMGICSAALNTGILNLFAAAPALSPADIIQHLSNPASRPDSRLLKIAEAAQLNPQLMKPIIPLLLQSLAEKGDMGRNVDRIVQNHIRQLGLFPISNWIDSPDAGTPLRDTIRDKLFHACGVPAKDRPIVHWTDLSVENLPELLSFSTLDHSHTALRAKDLTPFTPWLQRVRNLKLTAQDRLAFSAAPIPNPETEDRWTCDISSLTISPGTITFNRLAIEFDAVTEADLITALQQLNAPACATVYSDLMPLIGDKLKRVFTPLAIPQFQYIKKVSVQTLDTLLAAAPYSQARLITGSFGPNTLSVCPPDIAQPRLLWFESGDSTKLYRALLAKRGIALDDSPLDLTREEDLRIALAAWMCTYGTMGAAESNA